MLCFSEAGGDRGGGGGGGAKVFGPLESDLGFMGSLKRHQALFAWGIPSSQQISEP